jgi:hypothetical protein
VAPPVFKYSEVLRRGSMFRRCMPALPVRQTGEVIESPGNKARSAGSDHRVSSSSPPALFCSTGASWSSGFAIVLDFV